MKFRYEVFLAGLAVALFFGSMASPVFAVKTVSQEELQQKIENAGNSVVSLVTGVAVIVATLALVGCGIAYKLAGDNPIAKDKAKNVGSSAVVGLAIVLFAPAIIGYFAGLFI